MISISFRQIFFIKIVIPLIFRSCNFFFAVFIQVNRHIHGKLIPVQTHFKIVFVLSRKHPAVIGITGNTCILNNFLVIEKCYNIAILLVGKLYPEPATVKSLTLVILFNC